MHAMGAEDTEALNEIIACEIEVLEDGLETLGGDRLHADERTEDMGLSHGFEVFRILGGFHRDLSEKDNVRELCKLAHELELFFTNLLEGSELLKVILLAGEAKIRETYGIEVVVSERHEADALAAQLDDLTDDRIEGTLAGLLTIGSPDGAERAVLGAAARGLD